MKIIIMHVSNRKPVKAINQAVKKVWDIDPFMVLNDPKLRKLFVIGYAVALTLLPSTALAAAGASGGLAIIQLLQRASFWLGIGVVIWGVIESQLDLPGWKWRIAKGVLGYILILLVPMVFIELRDSLQIDQDTWNRLSDK
jgi:cell division protein FtsW (lipid II flippase)